MCLLTYIPADPVLFSSNVLNPPFSTILLHSWSPPPSFPCPTLPASSGQISPSTSFPSTQQSRPSHCFQAFSSQHPSVAGSLQHHLQTQYPSLMGLLLELWKHWGL